MSRLIIGVCTVLKFAFWVITAQAAEFKTLSSSPLTSVEIWSGTCTHTLVGPIKAGDAKTFEAELAKLPGQDHDDLNFILCLDSTGGSLSEAITISALLKRSSIGTYIPKGASCLSACAIVFMNGEVGFFENYQNFRMMHPTAKLGFHRPRLELALGNAPVPGVLVTSAYDAAILNIAELAESASRPLENSSIAVIPLSLLAQMLDTPANKFLYVETLHQAFSWDIEILPEGLLAPQGFDEEIAKYQLCRNALYEIEPQSFGFDITPGPSRAEIKIFGSIKQYSKPQVPKGHLVLVLDGAVEMQCSLKYRKGAVDWFLVHRYTEGQQVGIAWLRPVYLFHPSTKIRDLAPK